MDLNLSPGQAQHKACPDFNLGRSQDLNDIPTTSYPLHDFLSFSLGNNHSPAKLLDETGGKGPKETEPLSLAASHSSPLQLGIAAPASSVPPPHLLMAAYPVDPTPFLPGRYNAMEVAGWPAYCRYHVSAPVSAKHEDVAIATITPAPHAQVPFSQVRAFLRGFLEDHLQFSLEMTQRCPLGTAFVQLDSIADRDWLVDHSPHMFQNHSISFVSIMRGLIIAVLLIIKSAGWLCLLFLSICGNSNTSRVL